MPKLVSLFILFMVALFLVAPTTASGATLENCTDEAGAECSHHSVNQGDRAKPHKTDHADCHCPTHHHCCHTTFVILSGPIQVHSIELDQAEHSHVYGRTSSAPFLDGPFQPPKV